MINCHNFTYFHQSELLSLSQCQRQDTGNKGGVKNSIYSHWIWTMISQSSPPTPSQHQVVIVSLRASQQVKNSFDHSSHFNTDSPSPLILTTSLIIKDSWERIRQQYWFTIELVWIMLPPLQDPCFLWTVLLGFVWLVQVFRDKRLFLVKGGFTTPTPWTGHVKTLFMLIHRPPTHNYLGELMNSNGNI